MMMMMKNTVLVYYIFINVTAVFSRDVGLHDGMASGCLYFEQRSKDAS